MTYIPREKEFTSLIHILEMGKGLKIWRGLLIEGLLKNIVLLKDFRAALVTHLTAATAATAAITHVFLLVEKLYYIVYTGKSSL